MTIPFLIWQVHFDPFQKNILLELREENTGEVHFLSISPPAPKGGVNNEKENDFKDNYSPSGGLGGENSIFWQMPERFWVVTRKLQHGLAFIQCYPDHTRPEMVGIWVIDIFSNKILWKEPLAKFVEIEYDKILYQIQDKKFTQFIFEEKDFSTKNIKNSPEISYKTLFPEYYTQDLEYFELVKNFILKYFPDEMPLYELAYLETEKCLFIAYYFEQNLAKEKTVCYCIFDKEKNHFISKKTFKNAQEGFIRFWLYENYWIFTPNYKEILIEKIENF